MARKQETLVTYEIQFDLPAGRSLEQMKINIADVLRSKGFSIDTPKLVKKETTYE